MGIDKEIPTMNEKLQYLVGEVLYQAALLSHASGPAEAELAALRRLRAAWNELEAYEQQAQPEDDTLAKVFPEHFE